MSKVSDEDLERSLKLKKGLKILSMQMSSDGEPLWKTDWTKLDIWSHEPTDIYIPKEILSKKVVSRLIEFSTVESMKEFKVLQRVLFFDQCIEEWFFKMGFTIPNSTNTWENIIEASPTVMDAEKLSGNVIIESTFFDGDLYISQNKVRLHYV
mmetsp:Transcript_2274/g.3302  ORF Transcript_2274/g.3302 Transcript_2274/m.3302 type:complete len:153 (+) Transcript_2274:148-606(+)